MVAKMIYELDKIIEEQEYCAAKNIFIRSVYPDAKLVITKPSHYGRDLDETAYNYYTSISVNKTYTKIQFKEKWRILYMRPYITIEFEFKGKKETIKIFSSPHRKKLAYTGWLDKNKTIMFSKLALNVKNDNFKESLLKDCASGIMNYINNHKDHKIDTANLNERLKNLLVFI